VSPTFSVLALTQDPGCTVLWRLLTRYGLAQAYIPCPHSLFFFLLSTDSFSIDLVPSPHAGKENDCRLTTSHDQETRDFSGGIMDTFSMFLISIHFFSFPPPHPPYNPLHPASRFIVYFMIITLNARSPYSRAYSSLSKGSLLFSTPHRIPPLILHDAWHETSLLVPASQPPVVRTISVSSFTLTPFFPPHVRISLASLTIMVLVCTSSICSSSWIR